MAAETTAQILMEAIEVQTLVVAI
jgi:hypothetical protein